MDFWVSTSTIKVKLFNQTFIWRLQWDFDSHQSDFDSNQPDGYKLVYGPDFNLTDKIDFINQFYNKMIRL